MKIVSSPSRIQSLIKKYRINGKTIGFVPTMGDLHEGHLSLIRRCRKNHDVVVLSIFVNPTQFTPTEDYQAYPRDKKRDCLFARRENVDIIFYPSETEMYPGRCLTFIEINEMTQLLCGRTRPKHFRGVATIIAKLLNIVNPDVMYLGQKDAQQTIVIKQLIRDLNFTTRVAVLPTVRERDGLALSSRNKYLNPKQRREARVLYQALTKAKSCIRAGERRPKRIIKIMKKLIEFSTGKIDYIECVDAETLAHIHKLEGKVLLALAVKFGKARLIDNLVIRIQ